MEKVYLWYESRLWHYKYLWHMLPLRSTLEYLQILASLFSQHAQGTGLRCIQCSIFDQDLTCVTSPMTDWFDLFVVCIDVARWFRLAAQCRRDELISPSEKRWRPVVTWAAVFLAASRQRSSAVSEVFACCFIPANTWAAWEAESCTRAVESSRRTDVHSLCPREPEQCNAASGWYLSRICFNPPHLIKVE